MTNLEAIEVMFNEWKCIDRNDGVHCDRKCESCDLVMDVQIIREAFNKAISALQAQDSPKPTAESVQNVQNEDLISRKAAIDAVEHITSSMSVCVNTDECHGMKRMQRQAVIELTNLPSAQPDNRLEKIADLMEGTIDHFDRDDAMDLLYQIKEVFK